MGSRIRILISLIAFAFCWQAPGVLAAEDIPPSTLDDQVQGVKEEMLDLNREMFLLEEELLYPSPTQIVVFVSLDVGELFKLDAVQLKIDGKEVTNYLYTNREVNALRQGGMHRLHTDNLTPGEHELVAFFTGAGPHGRDYKRGATLRIKKELAPKFVELRITDATSSQQPEFEIAEW